MKEPSAWWCQIQCAKGLNGRYIPDAVVPGTNLSGKWIIITGGNNGIGLEAALSFSRWGANLILACREPPSWETHPTAAVQQCRDAAKSKRHVDSEIEWWQLDMADLDSVEAFASRWLATKRQLDILCNNAGVATPPSDDKIFRTKDGFEFIHQVNFLSHTLLTLRLLPSIAKASSPRIVCTTSCMHYAGKFDLDNFNWDNPGTVQGQPYDNNKLYFQTWLTELQHRMGASQAYRHVVINGVHPGYVASSIWNSNRPNPERQRPTLLGGLLMGFVRVFGITTQQGSLAITFAATDREVAERGGGRYFNRVWELESMPYCRDEASRLAVWKKVDEELGLERRGLSTIFD